jgi:hypothetical protein
MRLIGRAGRDKGVQDMTLDVFATSFAYGFIACVIAWFLPWAISKVVSMFKSITRV